jgi:hypothetical protein
MYNQNFQPIYLDRKYQNFFNLLENALKQEFASYGNKVTIINNYTLKREPILYLEILLSFSNNTIKLKVDFTTSFPKQQPIITCLDKFLSPIIDTSTREVNYNNLYNWAKNSNVKLLLEAIGAYFLQNPPVRLKELKDTQEKFIKIKQNLDRLMNLNIVTFENSLSNEEKKALYDENLNYDILTKSPEATEIKNEMKFIMNKMLTLLKEIDQEESTINSYVDLTKKDVENYEALKKRYKQLEASYCMLVDRFSRANILDFLENKKMRLDKQVREIKEKVRNTKCKDSQSIKELARLQSDLVATNNIYNQIAN